MSKKTNSTHDVNPKWFRHEALHSTDMVRDILDSHLIQHHYAGSGINPKYNEAIQRAYDALNEAYQACVKENEVTKTI